jgi:hypothetical protein
VALTPIRVELVLPRACPTRKGRRWGPCPACGAEHTDHDPRPPLAIVGNGLGWWCLACGVTGDAYDLASWIVLEVRARDAGRSFRQVLAWLRSDEVQHVEPRLDAPVERPRGIAEMLRACERPANVPEVAAYLEGRGLDPSKVPAGVVPARFSASWWPRAWSSTWRLVVPAVSGRGELLSVQVRAVAGDVEPRMRWPYGCSAGGLLFADPTRARPLLRREPSPATRLVIAEGLTDYLTVASGSGEDTAVLGVASGSVVALRLLELPETIRSVIVATDYDRQGEVYAQQIAEALAPRPVRRLQWAAVAWT